MLESDIRFSLPQEHFTLRATALIIQNGKLLVAKHDSVNCYYTVGGGVRAGETTEEAVIREAYEETGLEMETERLVFLYEGFFTHNGRKHHEVGFHYLMKEMPLGIPDGQRTDQEGERLFWLPIDRLENYDLVPAFLKTALKNMPDHPRRIVYRENHLPEKENQP